MRIAMLAPLELRVPPSGYGGTELVVSLLTEELVRRGEDVTLFASGDSVTSARLVSVCDRFVRGSGRDGAIMTMLNALACVEQADRFDIIHNHTSFEGMALAGLVGTPTLTTFHGSLSGDWRVFFEYYRGWYNTISQAMKTLLPPKERFAGVVYNAIDVDSYPFNGGERDGYLLFLSRMSSEKGPHLAIEVARLLNKPLILAGNVHPVDEQFFRTQVLPYVDGHTIRHVGEVGYQAKRELLSRASCLLAPITWPEPFGLFMAEAMACGTPVLVFNRGSAPEVVRHGVTGLVVETVEDMVNSYPGIRHIDPKACRDHVKELFDVPRMARDYLSTYQWVLSSQSAAKGASPGRRSAGEMAIALAAGRSLVVQRRTVKL